MADNKYAIPLVVMVLAICQLGVVSAASQQNNNGKYQPSQRYLDNRELLETTYLRSTGQAKGTLEAMMTELDEAARSGQNLGNYETERKAIAELWEATKPSADRCATDMFGERFVADKIANFQVMSPFEIIPPNMLAYRFWCESAQHSLCSNLKRQQQLQQQQRQQRPQRPQ